MRDLRFFFFFGGGSVVIFCFETCFFFCLLLLLFFAGWFSLDLVVFLFFRLFTFLLGSIFAFPFCCRVSWCLLCFAGCCFVYLFWFGLASRGLVLESCCFVFFSLGFGFGFLLLDFDFLVFCHVFYAMTCFLFVFVFVVVVLLFRGQLLSFCVILRLCFIFLGWVECQQVQPAVPHSLLGVFKRCLVLLLLATVSCPGFIMLDAQETGFLLVMKADLRHEQNSTK